MEGDAGYGIAWQTAVATATNAIREHLQEQKARAGDGTDALIEKSSVGATVDLGYHSLHSLPLELIDVVKDHLQRLALAHNKLVDLPPRLAECNHLRYLQIRSNHLRRIPDVIFDLPNLEVLDVGKNKIDVVPDNVTRLTSLRVLSLHHNRIAKLPRCLGHMTTLSRLIINDNPIVFPPRDIWEQPNDSEAQQAGQREKEDSMTIKVKEWLRNERDATRTDIEGDISESNIETPRPARRKTGGRFPIKPSISSTDLAAEALNGSPILSQAPPPLPTKSISRLSPENRLAMPRPYISPLITNNERFRSSSESHMTATHRAAKRIGLLPPARNLPDTRLEPRRSARLSHFRGLSHASALHNNVTSSDNHDSSSPTSPMESDHAFGFPVRRLSSLAEYRGDSSIPSPAVDVAKSIAFAIHQLRGPLEGLARVARKVDPKRSAWDKMCYSLYRFVKELDHRLAEKESLADDSEIDERSATSIQSATDTCIKALEQLLLELHADVPNIVARSDLRLVRSFMIQCWAGLVEMQSTCSIHGIVARADRRPPNVPVLTSSASAMSQERPITSRRMKRNTPYYDRNASISQTMIPNKPLPLSHNRGHHGSRSTTNTSGTPSTPRSKGSFKSSDNSSVPSLSRSNTLLFNEDPELTRQFEVVLQKMFTATELADQSLPSCNASFKYQRDAAYNRRAPRAEQQVWQTLCELCDSTINAADALRLRLASVNPKNLPPRNGPAVWQQLQEFAKTFTNLALELKKLTGQNALIARDTKQLLKPLHSLFKDLTKNNPEYPWGDASSHPHPYSHYANNTAFASNGYTSSQHSYANGSVSLGYPPPLPATPLSAALGPAAQATVPAVPHDSGIAYAQPERLEKSYPNNGWQ